MSSKSPSGGTFKTVMGGAIALVVAVGVFRVVTRDSVVPSPVDPAAVAARLAPIGKVKLTPRPPQ